MIPQETVNLILDTARIEDIVGDFVTLKRRGANFVACCPFHNEKTPSFYVSPSKGIFKCFGCGKAGSAVGFVMEHESCTYTEALKYLANKYNIEVREKEETAEDLAQRQHNESLLLVSDFAGKFFVQSLATDDGRNIATAYFKSRGLEDATIAKYGLGWAPKSRKDFTKSAQEAGYKDEYLLETGLCAQHDDGSLYDRFYDRVIFPIHSVSGRVIAFGGRTLRTDFKEAGVGKYVNSKESEIYDKSSSLYGIYFAKNEISRQKKCYLVEGYLDVLSMHQLGITNVVASSGTSLTVPQVRLIKKFADDVTIMYDGDSAGIHAAIRGIDLVLQEGLNVKIVLIPDGDDPDSYSRKHSLEEVKSFIESNERDFIEFKTELLLGEAGNDPLKKANLINDIADTIARIPDAVKRMMYMEGCAKKFRIEPGILHERINATRRREKSHQGPLQEVQQPSQEYTYREENRTLAQAEKDILYFLLTHGSDELAFPSDSEFYSRDEKITVADFIRSAFDADQLKMSNSLYRTIYENYFELYDASKTQQGIVSELMNSSDRTIASIVAQISISKHRLTVDKFEKALTTTSSWLATNVPRSILFYSERRLQNAIDQLRADLVQSQDDPQKTKEIMTEMVQFQSIQRKINQKLGRDK